MRFFAVVVTALLAGVLVGPAPAEAKRACKRSEMSIPDERGGGRTLCLKKSEWAKARVNCSKYAKDKKVDPMQCICQDGNSVGACGD